MNFGNMYVNGDRVRWGVSHYMSKLYYDQAGKLTFKGFSLVRIFLPLYKSKFNFVYAFNYGSVMKFTLHKILYDDLELCNGIK